MLVLYQLKTNSQPQNIKLQLQNSNIIKELSQITKTKYTSQFIIQTDEVISCIINDNKNSDVKVNFKKDCYQIINDDIDTQTITTGYKQITFKLQFDIQWPYIPHVSGSIKKLGKWKPQNAETMQYDGTYWNLTIYVPRSFEYKFIVRKFNTNEVIWEETPNRVYNILNDYDVIEINSKWQEKERIIPIKNSIKFVHFQIHYEVHSNNCKIVVVGNTEQFGKWNPHHGQVMRRYLDFNWKLGLLVQDNELEYKFVLIKENGECLWESCLNRELEFEERQQSQIVAFWNNQSIIKVRESELECPICTQEMNQISVLIGHLCGHLMCQGCYRQLNNRQFIQIKCPLCRKPYLI